ncbi:phage portal protein [Sporomusa acidovorans]|uniref:phage portal protein n=1 Tax=Sporomusa acidovorans TaxID=112900 RepID=UPI001B80B0CB|nr:phage portal protein [Sporomusa acidovorans]
MLWTDQTGQINQLIKIGAGSRMSDLKFVELELIKFQSSLLRRDMITGERYYRGDHDILHRRRMVIGEKGELEEVKNLPNNKLVDNQYGKLVDQKVNYLLAKPVSFESEADGYSKLLQIVFNKGFLRTLKNVGEDALNGGIAWLHPYYNDDGELVFKKFPGYEVLPFWADAEHTVLDFAVRVYQIEAYEGTTETIITKVEIYDKQGIHRYELKGFNLVPDVENPSSTHMVIEDDQGNTTGYNWDKVPLVAFKFNNKEIPLIKRVKSLQDAINTILSDFENNMQEDARNTILVLQNYDGTNLGEFRKNLSQYGVVKVKTVDGVGGDLKTLEITVNAENYKIIFELLKKALIENGRGFDAKDDRMGNNPNQMNIQSMYSDIDLDANGMETEFQAAFEQLLWFVNMHFVNTGQGDYSGQPVNVIFNRDILINESESIENCAKSTGILSNETIVSQHPWTTDVKTEMKRIADEKAQQQSEIDQYKTMFGGTGDGNEE